MIVDNLSSRPIIAVIPSSRDDPFSIIAAGIVDDDDDDDRPKADGGVGVVM